MAVKPFATNNLVKEHVMYKEFILKKWNDISGNGAENTDKLFWKKGCLNGVKVPDGISNPYKSLQKMHCMVLAYDIWCDCVKNCFIGTNSIDYKKHVHVTDDILKKFKYRFEQSAKNAGCSVPLDACRYLAMAWTYLDLTNATNQRYYPDKETVQKAAKIFGYKPGENPFIMNGKFWNWKKRKETKPVEQIEQNVDIGTVTLEDLDFSVRTYNCLKRSYCNTLVDIAKLSYHELYRIRNCGRHSICEIVAKLREYGLKPNNEETPKWVIDKIGPDPEESVIDIAEQAAKKVEEEEKLVSVDEVIYDYNALLEKYNNLKDDYDKLDATRSCFIKEIENLKDIITDLQKTITEKNQIIAGLENKIDDFRKHTDDILGENARLNSALNGYKSHDVLRAVGRSIDLMKEQGITKLDTCIGGYSVEIIQKYNIVLKEAGYGRV